MHKGNINLNDTTSGHKNKELGQTTLMFTRIAKWTNIISQTTLPPKKRPAL